MRFDLSARLVWLAVAGLAAGAGAAWIVSMAGPGRPVVLDVPLAVPVALQGIADRLGALGGTIDITAAPDRGTRLTGRVPAAAA
jgi:signal transduction histidine kinase